MVLIMSLFSNQVDLYHIEQRLLSSFSSCDNLKLPHTIDTIDTIVAHFAIKLICDAECKSYALHSIEIVMPEIVFVKVITC